MRATLFLLTKGVRELHVNQIGNNFTALPKAVTLTSALRTAYNLRQKVSDVKRLRHICEGEL